MDWQKLSGVDRSLLIDGFSNDVDNSSKCLRSDWHHNGVSSILYFLTSNQTFGRVKSNSSNIVTSQMLGDLKNESVIDTFYLKSVENWRKISLELYVNDGTNDL